MDERPSVWVGHAVLAVSDVEQSTDFWRSMGMREIERRGDVAVLELRGGTHLLLLAGKPTPDTDAPFDLMVEDLDATHADYADRGLEPSPITKGKFHTEFNVRDPNGYRVTVRSSHVVGPV